MNISLTPEQERVVEDELKSGRYHNIEQLLGAALRRCVRRDVMFQRLAPSETRCARCLTSSTRTRCDWRASRLGI